MSRDWKVVTSSVTRCEETEDPILDATLVNNEARGASEQLAFILVMISRVAALHQVANAGP